MKTLYFEGAGWSKAVQGYSDIPNCRIRTAFTNDKGEKIYLEIVANTKSKHDKKVGRNAGFEVGDPIAFIDFAHYITADKDIDDCNKSRVYYSDGTSVERNLKSCFVFTYENLLKFVNKTFGCSFDNTIVLNELTGYCVFSGKDRKDTETSFDEYVFGDEFQYDDERTQKRLAKMNELSEYFKQFMQYDNTSYWVDKNGDLVVRINTYDKVFQQMKFKKRQFTIKIS